MPVTPRYNEDYGVTVDDAWLDAELEAAIESAPDALAETLAGHIAQMYGVDCSIVVTADDEVLVEWLDADPEWEAAIDAATR